MKKLSLLIMFLSLGLFVTGCSKSPQEEQKDVVEEQEEGAKEIGDAEKDAAENVGEEQKDVGEAAQEGAEDVAAEKKEAAEEIADEAKDVDDAAKDNN